MIFAKRAKNIKESISIQTDDCIKINVLSWHKKDTEYYELSPYFLKTDGNESDETWPGIIFENFWQASKVFPEVNTTITKPHFSSNIIWWEHHGRQIHFENDQLNDEYFEWRNSIWNCQNPVRYPNSYERRHQCIFSRIMKNGKEYRYNYVQARKKIYAKNYMRLIRTKSSYHKILDMLKDGQKICIVEVDVPHEDKKGLYGAYANMELTMDMIKELVNDTSEPFGHGLALAAALLEDLSVS